MKDGPSIFSNNSTIKQRKQETIETELYEQIGRLKIELEWLKKKLPNSIETKRLMIDLHHSQISIRRQCELIGLNRSTLYYKPGTESELNLHLMGLLDEQYTKTPFYGWPRMTAHLRRKGYEVNHKRVQRLMQKIGLHAIYPKHRKTIQNKAHRTYPYLLRGLDINRPNQVWCADITYLPLTNGFMYLVAIMDWFSRYVIAWKLSNTLDGNFCVQALQQAMEQFGRPDIFNTLI